MTREQAITRVRKLLALAQDAGSTPAEQDTALKLAQKLVDEFAIQEHEVVVKDPAKEAIPSAAQAPQAPVVDPEIRAMVEALVADIASSVTNRALDMVEGAHLGELPKSNLDQIMKGILKR